MVFKNLCIFVLWTKVDLSIGRVKSPNHRSSPHLNTKMNLKKKKNEKVKQKKLILMKAKANPPNDAVDTKTPQTSLLFSISTGRMDNIKYVCP